MLYCVAPETAVHETVICLLPDGFDSHAPVDAAVFALTETDISLTNV